MATTNQLDKIITTVKDSLKETCERIAKEETESAVRRFKYRLVQELSAELALKLINVQLRCPVNYSQKEIVIVINTGDTHA